MLKFPLGPSRVFFFFLYLIALVQPSCLQDQISYLLLGLFYSIPQSFSFIDPQCFSLPGFQIVSFSNISISNMRVTSHIPPPSLPFLFCCLTVFSIRSLLSLLISFNILKFND